MSWWSYAIVKECLCTLNVDTKCACSSIFWIISYHCSSLLIIWSLEEKRCSQKPKDTLCHSPVRLTESSWSQQSSRIGLTCAWRYLSDVWLSRGQGLSWAKNGSCAWIQFCVLNTGSTFHRTYIPFWWVCGPAVVLTTDVVSLSCMVCNLLKSTPVRSFWLTMYA